MADDSSDGVDPRMKRRIVTALDVARTAGVHPSTVSRSLDPSKRDQVKAATRDRVVRVATELGYRPNLTASSLRRRHSNTVGVLISSFSNPIYGELLHGVSNELEGLGYHLLIAEVPDEADDERLSGVIDVLQARRIDGLITAASRGSHAEALRGMVETGLPVVLALRWIDVPGIPRVVNDDALGGAFAARHLLELGHERILEITGPMDISTFSERSRGFSAALDRAPGPVARRTLQSGTPSVEEGFRIASEVLEGADGFRPTALFAHNDLLAVGAMDAFARAGLACPADISVVGYNDNPLTQHLKPALTTIRLPIDRMGREAARAIVGLLADGGNVRPELSIAPELIVRESTSSPPANTPGDR